MLLLGCAVAGSAVQASSQSWKRAVPFEQASSDAATAANAVLKQAGKEECLRGKLSNAIVQLSNSCDVAGLSSSFCLMASSIAGEDNDLSMGEMMTASKQLLLMLEPSTTTP
jgi:hypothetical protein